MVLAAMSWAALALIPASPVAAQATGDVNSFELQPQATPTPRAAGPAAPDGSAPRPNATSTPAVAATISAPAATAPARSVAPTPAPTRAARPATAVTPPPRTAPSPSPAPSTGTTPAPPPSDTASTSALPDLPLTPVPAATASTPASTESGTAGLPWLPIAAGTVALLLAGGAAWALMRRRSGQADAAADFVAPSLSRPASPSPEPAGKAVEPAAAQTLAAQSLAAQPLPAQPIIVTALRVPDTPLLSLEARRVSATLVNATLSYRLAVTNPGSVPIEDIQIGGDMIAAHATRPVEEQIASDTTDLPPLHRIATLAPGESVMLGGDIRLPLAAIRPIRHGEASLFVPLVRFAAAWAAADGRHRRHASTFLVGQLPPAASERLQPFRLDLGPRMYGELGQRLLAGGN